MRKCQKCGVEVEKDDLFCPDCGKKLTKETKKVTVWTVIKVIAMILLFIVFVQLLKNNPPIGIVFFVLTVTWTGILNSVLKKLFNTEISTGVKIIITVVVIVLLVSVSQFQTTQLTGVRVQEKASEFRYGEPNLYKLVERINRVIVANDHNSLEIMQKEDVISQDVFEGLLKFLERRDDTQLILRPQDQRFHGDQAEMNIMVTVESGSNKRRAGVTFFFEKTEHGWRLFAIKPDLLEVKLERSFGEEAEYQIEKISKPIAISKTETVKAYN